MLIVKRPAQEFTTQPVPPQVEQEVISEATSSGDCDFPRYPQYLKATYSTTTVIFLSPSRACNAAAWALHALCFVFHFVFQGCEIEQGDFLSTRAVKFLLQLTRERVPLTAALCRSGYSLPLPDNSSLVRAACASFAGPETTLHMSVFNGDACIFTFGARGVFEFLHEVLRDESVGESEEAETDADSPESVSSENKSECNAEIIKWVVDCPVPLPQEPTGVYSQEQLSSATAAEMDQMVYEYRNGGANCQENRPFVGVDIPDTIHNAPGTIEFFQIGGASTLKVSFAHHGTAPAPGDELCQFFAREDVKQVIGQAVERSLSVMQIEPGDILMSRDGFLTTRRIMVSEDIANAMLAAVERGEGDAGAGYVFRSNGEYAVLSQRGTEPEDVF